MTSTPAWPPATDNAEQTLARALRTLKTVETVLVHTSDATGREITAILAKHADDHGGLAFLIDTIQFDAAALERHINHN